MAKKPKTLTARRMAKLPPGRYRDPEVPGLGLYLQVAPGGTKSWLLRYQVGDLERFMGLGSAALFSLKQARQRAIEARRLLADNIDPIEHRKAERDAKRAEAINNVTFKAACEEYIALHADGWRNAKHRQQWRNTLRSYAYPSLGERLVSGIDAATINDAVAPIWQRIPSSAARTKGRIERVCKWVREGKPLPKPASAKREHQPALPYEQMSEFMADLRPRASVSARALEFLILTATRTGATIGAVWPEIDFDKRVWTIPGSRDGTKIKDRNDYRTVPLSDEAIALLEALPREEGNPQIFIGGRKGKPLSNMALNQMLRRMNADRQKKRLPKYIDPKQNNRAIVPHGFRSSFRDWAGDQTAFPREVIEAAMAHASGVKDETEAAYRRGSALEKRRTLMTAWARYATSPAPAGEVVSIGRGRK